MALRGKVAVVGIGEIPTRRSYPGRTMHGLCSEVARLAIEDAGLRKEDIDGLVTDGEEPPGVMTEYLGMRPTFATGVTMHGASGATATMVAAAAINVGLCNTALVVIGNSQADRARAGGRGPSVRSEWEDPYGMAPGANTGYGLMYQRHMHEYGTKPEQMAKLAVDQRFNALTNENAVFRGQPITVDDVLNSRYVNYPLHMLECVSPLRWGGGVHPHNRGPDQIAAPSPCIYPRSRLGAGLTGILADAKDHDHADQGISGRRLRPQGYAVRRILRLIYHPRGRVPRRCRVCEKGRDWPVLRVHRYYLQGQLSHQYGRRPAFWRAAFDGREIQARHRGCPASDGERGRGGERQVARNDLCMVNGSGGTASEMCSLVLGSKDTLQPAGPLPLALEHCAAAFRLQCPEAFEIGPKRAAPSRFRTVDCPGETIFRGKQ